MKNKILLIATFAFSVSAEAQNSNKSTNGDNRPAFSEDKSLSNDIDDTYFLRIDREWDNINKPGTGVHTITDARANDYFCMAHDKMYAVVNGTSTSIDTYITLQDGSVLMPYGAVITSKGIVIHLKNGERVNMQEGLTCAQKTNRCNEQAAEPEEN